jgi:Rod binding domain-containing protein
MSVAPITSHAAVSLEPLAHAHASQLKGAALRNASPAEQRTAVAAQFEAILVRQLLGKTMTSMLGGSDSGVAGSVYGDMLADTISQQLTSGPGLGLGRFLEKQLTPRGELVNEPAASPTISASTQANP